ncbi:hypothetical protein [Stieleria mannarensis]|uniref:hypothetical protein n=1 Tax=Stieleria mannarensis TaxID=2755585 RepID=UPI0016038A10|nr:hypothetical protein [Rhodopirellula sp. JC639]
MKTTTDSTGEIVEINGYEGASPNDDLLGQISSLKKLRKLILRSVPDKRIAVNEDWFSDKASLESVALINCDISSTAFKALLRIATLGSLDLTGCHIAPGKFSITGVRAINVSFAACNLGERFLTRLIDCGLFDHAEIVNLNGNHVSSDHILRLAARATVCEELSLNQTDVGDPSIPGLLKLTSLAVLDINDSKFTGQGFEELCRLTQLEQLRANRVRLSVEQVAAFIKHPRLTRFEFDYSSLSVEERHRLDQKQRRVLKARRTAGR